MRGASGGQVLSAMGWQANKLVAADGIVADWCGYLAHAAVICEGNCSVEQNAWVCHN